MIVVGAMVDLTQLSQALLTLASWTPGSCSLFGQMLR